MLQKFLFASILLMAISSLTLAETLVQVERVPDQGIQPRLIQDQAGDIHLVYFKKSTGQEKSRQGDLYYRQWNARANHWHPAVKVSSQSYRHLGPVSKASVAIDGEGRLHVVWYLSASGEYRYTRSNTDRSHFEATRSPVVARTEGLEAEASIAVRGARVTITWHAGDLRHESKRAVYTLTSVNHGESFGEVKLASDPALGACACCSLATAFDREGQLLIAYRSAIADEGRHMQLLTMGLSDKDNNLRTVGEWNINSCPVSTNVLYKDWLAFEIQGEIRMMNVTNKIEAQPLRESEVRQKHPAIAINRNGERLLVWGEAPGYFQGGSLQMQRYNSRGEPVETSDHSSLNIPDFSVAATAARPDGTFLVLY